jgi:cob(I)alamin adenosyltransferase
MVLLSKIYTRTGDDGSSALASGQRRPKTDIRFEAIGTIDELNATIGLARLHANDGVEDLGSMLARIQNDLFDLGADLATPGHDHKRERLRITAAQVVRIETEIDALNTALEPLTSFVLPGGTALAAALHHTRTVARRAERIICALHDVEPLNTEVLGYINRVSDFFFVAARTANNLGRADVLWKPGENR